MVLDIPQDFPDLTMDLYDSEEIEDLRDVSLADYIKESRRRVKVRGRLPETTGTNPDPDATSGLTEGVKPIDPPCASPTMDNEYTNSDLISERNLRRRLNTTDPDGRIYHGPAFFGKTPVKNISDKLSSISITDNFLQKLHYDQIKAPLQNISDEDRLADPEDLDQLSRFLYQVHERLRGGLHYSSYQEQWIINQLVPNSTAAEDFKLKWDNAHERYEVNGTDCRFRELSEFREFLLKSLYGRNNLYQLVTRYIDKLSVSRKQPKSPSTCMELILRAERVYALLAVPHNVSVIDQIAVIIKRLPTAASSAIELHAITKPSILCVYDDLKSFVKIIDDAFKKELGRKQSNYNSNNKSGKKPYQHRNSSKQHQQQQNGSDKIADQHNNNMQVKGNNLNSKNNKNNIRTPFTGTCDHCGIKGHKVRDCRKASDAVKAEWLKKFNDRRDAKRKQPDEPKS